MAVAEEDQRLGAALRQGREARELPVDQVADALFLTAATVRALEAEDWEQLPSPVFVRGYIRNYARFLAVDQNALLQAYDDLAPASSHNPPTGEAARWGDLDKRHLRRLGLMGAIILLLVAGAAFVWWTKPFLENGGDGAPQTPAQPTTAVPDSAPLPAEPALREAAPRSGPSPRPDSAPSPAEPAPQDSPPTGADDLPTGPQLLQRHVRITPDGEDELELAFTGKSWVEVRNTDAKQLYAAEGRQGELWRLEGQGPFHLVLGYAPGITLRFNGEAVSLRQHTEENQVASLVLGR